MAIRPHSLHMYACTFPSVGYLPVQKLRLSSGKRYDSGCVPRLAEPKLSLSITRIGDIAPLHPMHVLAGSFILHLRREEQMEAPILPRGERGRQNGYNTAFD
jgi:hypothetical protein